MPHGFLPKLLYFSRQMPRPNLTWFAAIVVLGASYPLALFVADSEYFQVKSWSIQGAERLTEAEIRWTLGITEAAAPNILAFQQSEAIEMLEALPQVHNCRIEKQFPDIVEITVFERIAKFIVVSKDDMFVVDLEGKLFAKATAKDLKTTDLPLLSVSKMGPLKLGDTLPEEVLDLAFLYKETLKSAASPLTFEISEFHIEQGVGLSLIMRQGTTLICGFLPPSKTLPKYEALLQSLLPTEPIQYVDLRIESHIPYKLGSPRPAIQAVSATPPSNTIAAR